MMIEAFTASTSLNLCGDEKQRGKKREKKRKEDEKSRI